MKRLKISTAVVFALLVLLSGAAVAAPDMAELGVTAPSERVEAPGFTLKDTHGDKASLADYRGRVVLLNFWATWCPPCRDEVPALQRLFASMKGEKFVVIGVAVDRGSLDAVERFGQETGVTYPVLLDPEGTARNAYEVNVLPTSYIIGKDGRITGRITGPRQWDSPGFREFLGTLAAK